MKSYSRYIQFLQDFQFRKINPLQNVEASDNYRFGNNEELNPLKKFIIAELKVAAPGNVKLKLKKLQEIHNFFISFDKNYPALYAKAKAGLLKPDDLENPYMLNLKTSLAGIEMSTEFVKKLYGSVLFRQESVLDLMNRIEDLLASVAPTNIASA